MPTQPLQVFAGTPNGEFSAIDNSAAPTFPSLNAGTHIGYDTTAPGANSQGTNPFGGSGTVLLDPNKDVPYLDPSICTVVGNPVSNITPSVGKITTVLNNATTGIRILFKSPA
jgi:hypothetical protein